MHHVDLHNLYLSFLARSKAAEGEDVAGIVRSLVYAELANEFWLKSEAAEQEFAKNMQEDWEHMMDGHEDNHGEYEGI